MTKAENIQKLKGISYSNLVTDLDLANISGVFTTRRLFDSSKSISLYMKGIRILEGLHESGDASFNSLFFFQKIGNGNRFNTKQLIGGQNSNLYKELTILSDTLGLNKSIKTEEGLKAAETYFQEAVEIFRYVTKVDSLDEVDIDKFQNFILPLRTQEDRWHEDLTPQNHKALRSIALCLNQHFNTADFGKCVSVQRSDTQFKTKDLFERPDKHMERWVNSWNEFLDAKKAFSTKPFKNAVAKFRDFLEATYSSDSSPFPEDPKLYFSKYRNDEYYKWLNEQVDNNQINNKVLITALNAINSYSNWFIATYMSDVEEDGELVTIGHPIVSNYRFEQILLKHGDDDNGDIKLSESAKPSPPLWMVLKLKEILTENDYAWPKSLTNQYNNNIVDENGNPVWIPVITYLFLIMLEIPLRKIQVLRLDSGEGDIWKYDAKSDLWVKNDHQAASYWKNTGAKIQNRGVFRRKMINATLAPQFAFYINSNKTADKSVGFGEKSGYEIPWKNQAAIKYLDELRDWQEKYNPVTVPVKYKDIPGTIFDGTPSEKVVASIPDRFYLFRSAKEVKDGTRQMPPSNSVLNNFWLKLMEELERQLHDEGIDCQIIINRNKKTGAPQQALYTPHGLRVAGLTSLAQQGVPIDILSKIVAGHKSILMTIYYLKYHPSHISEVLNEASRDLELKYQSSFQNWLKEAAWDQVAKYTAYNSEDAVDGIKSAASSFTASLWNSTNLGLCPYNGTRCNDGGACVRKNGKGNNTYLPVKDKNCVMCRHFITGLPWLTELWVHGNALLLKSEKMSKELETSQQEIHKLKSNRLKLKKNGEDIPTQLTTKIKKSETIHERNSIELDNIFNELHSTHLLIEKIKALPKPPVSEQDDAKGSNLPALFMHNDSEFELDYIEMPSNFQNLDFVIQASRFYKHERNEDFEREREQFIDSILLRNGYEPLMLMDLTPEEKRQSADAFAKFLVTKVDAETLQLLKDGRTTLAGIGIEKELMEATPVNIPKNLLTQQPTFMS